MRNCFTILLLLISGCYCGAQTLQQTIAAAESLAAAKPDSAATLYDRALFFATDSATKTQLAARLAECRLNHQQYGQAAQAYTLTALYETNPDTRMAWQYRAIRCYVLAGDYVQAVALLYDDENEHSMTPTLYQQKLLYMGICYFHLNEADSSHAYFGKLARLTGSDTASFARLHAKHKKLLKSGCGFAAISYIIPGSGQLIYGDARNAANAFVLDGALIGLGVYMATAYTVVDALVAVAPWFARYYIENGKMARADCGLRKERKLRKLYNAYLEPFSKK